MSRGRGRALSFQLRISNGDPSSILISGTFMVLMVTESRFYKPSKIPSNCRSVLFRGYILHLARHSLWLGNTSARNTSAGILRPGNTSARKYFGPKQLRPGEYFGSLIYFGPEILWPKTTSAQAPNVQKCHFAWQQIEKFALQRQTPSV